MHQLQHRSYLVCTTAGAVYCQTQKYLWVRAVTNPDPEPASMTDTSDVSNKDKNYMHAPQKPYILHAKTTTPPSLVAHQCNTPTEQPHNLLNQLQQQTHSATRVQYNPILNQRFQQYLVCQPPRFLLALLVIPQW